jgi:glycosyltransferase involved in cell wall biosynthesis
VSTKPGVNIIGFLEAELGLGEIGRKLVLAAERAGIPTSTVTYRNLAHRQEHPFQARGNGDAPFDTNIICVNAGELRKLRRQLGADVVAGRYTIGVWFWELARFPRELHHAFDLVDEVWVASDFTRAAIAAETAKPVRIVPIPLEPTATPAVSREELGLPEGFLYLFSFDHFSILERKNPIGLVEAFRRAFTSGEGPILLIRSINGDRLPKSLERLEAAAAGRRDIRIVDGYISSAEKDAVFGACDCYVSLHRSEGLGLTMAEAMAVAKPVIATGYSGNLTFMDESNSYLVRYEMTETPAGCEPYPPGIEWAKPDVDHAAELLRLVYDRRDEARAVGERARGDLRERHTLDRTAEFIRERVSEIPGHERLFLAVRGPLDHAAERAQSVPGQSLEKKAGGSSPVRAVRLMLRRALWPELADQRRLDNELIESLRALELASRIELEALRRDAHAESERIRELERTVDELRRGREGS